MQTSDLPPGFQLTSPATFFEISVGEPPSARTKLIKQIRFQGQFDMFNVLNSNRVLQTVETFGSALDRPTAILQGRLIAVGMQMNF